MTVTPRPDVVADLRALHAQTTQGVWGKGRSTHESVSRYPNAPPYHVADFRHANDASFIDACHEHLPAILDELEALRAATRNQFVAVQTVVPRVDMAPPTTLPSWSECSAAHDANKEWNDLSGADRPRDLTALEKFIYEYDDSDPKASSWFMHHLSEVLAEASCEFKTEDGALVEGIRSAIIGMSVSVDVSTCDDANNRYFGVVSEVMDASSADKFGVVLLVQDATPNFTPGE